MVDSFGVSLSSFLYGFRNAATSQESSDQVDKYLCLLRESLIPAWGGGGDTDTGGKEMSKQLS